MRSQQNASFSSLFAPTLVDACGLAFPPSSYPPFLITSSVQICLLNYWKEENSIVIILRMDESQDLWVSKKKKKISFHEIFYLFFNAFLHNIKKKKTNYTTKEVFTEKFNQSNYTKHVFKCHCFVSWFHLFVFNHILRTFALLFLFLFNNLNFFCIPLTMDIESLIYTRFSIFVFSKKVTTN